MVAHVLKVISADKLGIWGSDIIIDFYSYVYYTNMMYKNKVAVYSHSAVE
jgi:hypothetical protein